MSVVVATSSHSRRARRAAPAFRRAPITPWSYRTGRRCASPLPGRRFPEMPGGLARARRRGAPQRWSARMSLEDRPLEEDGRDLAEVPDPAEGFSRDEQQVGALADGDLAEVGIAAGEKRRVLPR